MTPKPRYLTKSRFKLALECPAKLFYTQKDEYANQNLDNEFLQSLAEGGYQVGELAKCYHPGGVTINLIDYDEAIKETNKHLKKEKVTLFEAAFRYKNLFIRADIIIKNRNKIELIEVKAKSYDSDEDKKFLNNKGYLDNAWRDYVYDVAFQKYVITKALPQYSVRSYLMLADKAKRATVDGLNQQFFIKEDENGRIKIITNPALCKKDLGDEILVKVSTDDIISKIFKHEHLKNPNDEMEFEKQILLFEKNYKNDRKIVSNIGAHCGNCEFKASDDELKAGKKCGFQECWKDRAGLSKSDFKKTMTLKLWGGSAGARPIRNNLIESKKYFMDQIEESDIFPERENNKKYSWLSGNERRMLQIEKTKTNDYQPYCDVSGLKTEMNTWKYPLHFIDFETSAVAIPFNKGLRPYEGIAFQFSHHQVEKNGKISHKGQWLNAEQGKFPNFDFIRALKKELENDTGTIFRYHAHENNYLNIIHTQLKASKEKDKNTLCAFIETISHSSGNSVRKWSGNRDMVDMYKLVVRYYYSLYMGGSNSLKDVLPAMIKSSKFLQKKYSKNIYGKGKEIESLNFDEKIWLDPAKETFDPYKTLGPVIKDVKQEVLDQLITGSGKMLADGGAAMTAYARMQFTQMGKSEREYYENALLKYCELDTLAMVMIWEGWNDIIKNTQKVG